MTFHCIIDFIQSKGRSSPPLHHLFTLSFYRQKPWIGFYPPPPLLSLLLTLISNPLLFSLHPVVLIPQDSIFSPQIVVPSNGPPQLLASMKTHLHFPSNRHHHPFPLLKPPFLIAPYPNPNPNPSTRSMLGISKSQRYMLAINYDCLDLVCVWCLLHGISPSFWFLKSMMFYCMEFHSIFENILVVLILN